MEKFSKLKPKNDYTEKKEDILYSNKYIKVINFEDWTVVKESDFVVCIIYLIDVNQIVLRYEYIPTFKMVDGQEYHITILSGGIEVGETPEVAVLREIEEEAGIVINPEFKIEFMKPLFVSKGNASKYHPCIIQLTENDYHEIIAKTDGSKAEKLSRCVKVDIKYINSVNTSDVITEFMLDRMKDYLNL